MKTKKQYALQKSVMSEATFEKTVIRDIASLQKECEYESNRLLKLRQEIKDAENQKKWIESEKASIKRSWEEFNKDTKIISDRIVSEGIKNTQAKSDAKKYLESATSTLKLAETKIKTSESMDRLTTDISNVNQARLQKAADIESKNEKAMRLIADQQTKNTILISQLKVERKMLSIEKEECARKVLELNKLQKKLDAISLDNKEKLEAARLLELNSKKTLAKAAEESKFSQLSVERQWATIEVEQGKVKNRILRIKKFCIENKIDWNNIEGDPEESK